MATILELVRFTTMNYLDIGLHDTMDDLFVNLIGAATCSVIGYLAIKGSEKHTVRDSRILSALLVRPSARGDLAAPPEEQAG